MTLEVLLTLAEHPNLLSMSERELFAAAQPCWLLNRRRASQVRYLRVIAQDHVGAVAEVTGFTDMLDDQGRLRSKIEGHLLEAGHPVRDAAIGTPCLPRRNPVRYVAAS